MFDFAQRSCICAPTTEDKYLKGGMQSSMCQT